MNPYQLQERDERAVDATISKTLEALQCVLWSAVVVEGRSRDETLKICEHLGKLMPEVKRQVLAELEQL